MTDPEGRPTIDQPADSDRRKPPLMVLILAALLAVAVVVVVVLYRSLQTEPPDVSPASTPPTTRTTPPTPSPTTPPAPTLQLVCALEPASPKPGQQATVTYTITSNTTRNVGLGAGIYDDEGDDSSTGTGDIDSFPVEVGKQTTTRILPVPRSLKPGTYEITAELWPPNAIGADGTDTLVDSTCATITVP
jgi:hypothetical protein